MLGLHSANSRRYTAEAIRAAAKLYEKIPVNADHGRGPDDPRSVKDLIGWFESVRIDKDGGLRGDLHLLDPTDALSVKVMAAAESAPHLYGFSHAAEGSGHTDKDGCFVVERVERVLACDLVRDPATTGGMAENRRSWK